MNDVEDSGEEASVSDDRGAWWRSVIGRVRDNLAFRSKWSEVNGAMGDLGTYIPIILSLVLARGLNLGTTLIFTGAYNIATGALYGVPMPVQPMKSIAATAISSPEFGVPEIMAAGICSAAAVFILGVTGLMGLAYRLIPLPVVRGVQLAQGLSFAMTAVKYIRTQQDLAGKSSSSSSSSSSHRQWLGLDGLLVAVVSACFIIIVNGAGEKTDVQVEVANHGRRRRIARVLFTVPSAVIVFLLGGVLAVARKPGVVRELNLGPSPIEVVKISTQAWRDGFIKGAVPQIPLSVLNSVIAVCKLSTDLFPERDTRASATSVSITVGAMNLVGCWFGAMPCCHGAGGLAGQYKFGGRSGACVALLGAGKMVAGLLLGSSLFGLMVEFPVGLLGVLLLFAGVELAMTSRDMGSTEESFVMLVCTAVSLVGSSAALGFVCGVAAHALLKLRGRVAENDAPHSAPVP